MIVIEKTEGSNQSKLSKCSRMSKNDCQNEEIAECLKKDQNNLTVEKSVFQIESFDEKQEDIEPKFGIIEESIDSQALKQRQQESLSEKTIILILKQAIIALFLLIGKKQYIRRFRIFEIDRYGNKQYRLELFIDSDQQEQFILGAYTKYMAFQDQVFKIVREFELKDLITKIRNTYFSKRDCYFLKDQILIAYKQYSSKIQSGLKQFQFQIHKVPYLQIISIFNRKPRSCVNSYQDQENKQNEPNLFSDLFHYNNKRQIYVDKNELQNIFVATDGQELNKIIQKFGVQVYQSIEIKSKKQFFLFKFKTEKDLTYFKDKLKEICNSFQDGITDQEIFQITLQEFDTQGDRPPDELLYNQIPLEQQLKIINKQLRKGNVFAFKKYWNRNMIQKIYHIQNNWDVYSQQFQQQLNTLALLIDYKFQKFKKESLSIYELVYKGIQYFRNKLVNFFTIREQTTTIEQLKQIMKNALIDEKDYDPVLKTMLDIEEDNNVQIIINLYLQEKEQIRNNKSRLILNINKIQKIKFQNFIAEKKMNYSLPLELSNLFYQIDHILQIHSRNRSKQYSKNAINYINTIEQQKIPEHKCLGCSAFFIQDMPIYDQSINKIPLKIFASTENMRQLEQQIKNQISCMLNGGGGILLFDCDHDYDRIRPRGRIITEREKDELEQRFLSYLDVFEPRNQAKKSIKISFLPIYENPYEKYNTLDYSTFASQQFLIKPNQYFKVRQYLKGTFIMRVRICPCDPTLVFFWKQNSNATLEEKYRNFSCSIKVNKVDKTIKMKNIRKQIKKKLREYYLPENLNSEQRKLMAKPFTNFDHECRQPQSGVFTVQQSFRLDKSSSKEYDYASMIIVNQTQLSAVVKAFKEENIEVKIQKPFDCQNIPNSKHSGIMYHNTKFQNILAAIKNNNRFHFANRQLNIISITNYLKLLQYDEDRPYQDFQALVKWFRTQFKTESIRLYEFIPQKGSYKRQYFIQCESHKATLYIYYVLNFLKDKVLFKNPFHLDKKTEEERKECFRLLREDSVKVAYIEKQNQQSKIMNKKLKQMFNQQQHPTVGTNGYNLSQSSILQEDFRDFLGVNTI